MTTAPASAPVTILSGSNHIDQPPLVNDHIDNDLIVTTDEDMVSNSQRS